MMTVMVSILSHTFSTINEDAAAEVRIEASHLQSRVFKNTQQMFRRAVSTVEGYVFTLMLQTTVKP